jgi:hypothetical protein
MIEEYFVQTKSWFCLNLTEFPFLRQGVVVVVVFVVVVGDQGPEPRLRLHCSH